MNTKFELRLEIWPNDNEENLFMRFTIVENNDLYRVFRETYRDEYQKVWYGDVSTPEQAFKVLESLHNAAKLLGFYPAYSDKGML
jgi:hypothetical protein